MHLAAWKGREAVLELLIRSGADINARSEVDNTVKAILTSL